MDEGVDPLTVQRSAGEFESMLLNADSTESSPYDIIVTDNITSRCDTL